MKRTTRLKTEAERDVRAWTTPARFAHDLSNGRFVIPRHIALIDEAVTDCIRGIGPSNLVIEVPPRHGKSELISKWMPAWYLSQFPEDRLILTSHGDKLARSWGRKARDLFTEHGHRLDSYLSPTQTAANDWETTEGGGMITSGIGGGLVGRGGNILLVDDYLRNAKDAISDVVRDAQWDWLQSVALTRLEPGGKAIWLCTRWHQDDMIGRLKKQQQAGEIDLRIIRLPALAEDDDPLGRQPGEALWPERYSTTALELRRAQMTPYLWSCLYQQRPTLHDRAEWTAEYFTGIWADRWPERFEYSVIAVDPSKGKSSRKGDYSAIVFIGWSNGVFYVDADIQRRPVDQIVLGIIAMQNRYGVHRVGVEANAFQDLLQPIIEAKYRELNLLQPAIFTIANTVDKYVRVSGLTPQLKNLRFRRESMGTQLLLDQLQSFPVGDHDDGPDALEMGMRFITELYYRGDFSQAV